MLKQLTSNVITDNTFYYFLLKYYAIYNPIYTFDKLRLKRSIWYSCKTNNLWLYNTFYHNIFVLSIYVYSISIQKCFPDCKSNFYHKIYTWSLDSKYYIIITPNCDFVSFTFLFYSYFNLFFLNKIKYELHDSVKDLILISGQNMKNFSKRKW